MFDGLSITNIPYTHTNTHPHTDTHIHAYMHTNIVILENCKLTTLFYFIFQKTDNMYRANEGISQPNI